VTDGGASDAGDGGRGIPPGTIVLVGTPIGNLGDLSPRAVDALRSADVICCEDTRRTRVLLSAAGIAAPRLVAVEAHREAAGAAFAVARAAAGERVAVVTDAGMPGVSDPGERIVRAAVDAGIPVGVVPGPTAAVTAVVLSALPTERWCFEGFLPRKGAERAARLAAVADETRASVLYEAPHRLARTIADLAEVCGPARPVALARELTKLHEEVWRGTLGEAASRVGGAGPPRGEWVLVVGGGARAEADDEEILAALRAEMADGGDRRAAVPAVARRLGVPRRRVYDLARISREAPGSESIGGPAGAR
jgi:16S rRNA (cytidine1402-2'-O)-methyltransferase